MRCSRTSATWWAASSGSKRSSPRAWIICSEPCRSPVSVSRGWTSRRRTSTCPSRSGGRACVPGELTVHQQVPAQVVGDGRGLRTQGLDEDVLTRHGLQPVGEGPQRLVVQGHGPGAGHRRRHGRVGGLEGVVPVAVAVRDEVGSRQDVLPGGGERALEVRAHRRGRHRWPASTGAYQGTLRRAAWRHRTPGGTGRGRGRASGRRRRAAAPSGSARPREEAERLGPGPVGVLRREDAKEQGARVGLPVEREQQLERTLRHVPRPPGAARELLEAARGQEVHQGVPDQPGQAHGERLGLGCGTDAHGRDLRPPVVGSLLHRLGPPAPARGTDGASGLGGVDGDLDVEPRAGLGAQRDHAGAAAEIVVEQVAVIADAEGGTASQRHGGGRQGHHDAVGPLVDRGRRGDAGSGSSPVARCRASITRRSGPT